MGKNDETGAAVDADLQAHIGRKLKANYDDVLSQPIPDRFLDLLKQLEEKETGEAAAPTGEGEDAR